MARAVADASVLIHLAGIGQLDLLPAAYECVLVPEAVWREVVTQGRAVIVVQAVTRASERGWLQRRAALNAPIIQHLRLHLHDGEAEAIALALEAQPEVLLMDESDGRAAARSFGLRTQGIVGLLLEAKQAGRLPALRPLLDALIEDHFYLEAEFVRRILHQAGEA